MKDLLSSDNIIDMDNKDDDDDDVQSIKLSGGPIGGGMKTLDFSPGDLKAGETITIS